VKKIDKHVGLIIFYSTIMVMMVLFSINTLFVFIDELNGIRADYQFPQVIKFMFLTIPKRLYSVLPVSVLIGSLLGLGRLGDNSELVVMRTSGISLKQIGWMVFKPTILCIFIGMLLGETVVPISEQMAMTERRIERSIDGKYSDEGIWHREGNTFMFFNIVQPNGILHGVARYVFDDNHKMLEHSFADRAIYQGDHWVLEDVTHSHFNENKISQSWNQSEVWRTGLSTLLLKSLVVKSDDLSMHGLQTYINYLEEQGLDSSEYELSFWKKMLQPLSSMTLVLVAMSFVFGPLRSVSMGFRLFIGVITGVVFLIVQNIAGPASLVFGFSPLIAVAIPTLFCGVLGIILLRRVA